MRRFTLVTSAAACMCFGLAAPALAAQPPIPNAKPQAADMATPAAKAHDAAAKSAGKCLTDLRAFSAQMQKGGYWLGGSGYGYGYPVGGTGYGYGNTMMGGAASAPGYQNARPGYELRTLVASANILARHGQEKPCEDVLTTADGIYKTYVADMQSGNVPMADVPNWQQKQIAAAQPVVGATTAFRSDELLGIDVRDPQDNALGSVDDLVMSPATGKIAYLVIGRGGIFGINEKYVPVPWEAFKVTPGVNLLVLDTTKAIMDAAPQVSSDQFATFGHFDQESQKVDAYWNAHLSGKAASSD